MDLVFDLIHDNFKRKIVFGKLLFAVAPFVNNSMLLVDPTLSGRLNLSVVLRDNSCQETSLLTEMLIASKSPGEILKLEVTSQIILSDKYLEKDTEFQKLLELKILKSA